MVKLLFTATENYLKENNMSLLSLTYQEFERLLRAFALTTVLIALTIFLVRWIAFDAQILPAFFQSLTAALSISTIGFGIFSRRTWDSQRFARWLSRPMIHGVWQGHLSTNYLTEEGNRMRPIEIYFVIKQTYLSVSIESFTKTQEGESRVEALIKNAKTDSFRLFYMFELRRLYNGENKLTTGSGELRLIESGTRLRGHYWTNSPTQGDIDLRLISRDCSEIDCYEAAEEEWRKASADIN